MCLKTRREMYSDLTIHEPRWCVHGFAELQYKHDTRSVWRNSDQPMLVTVSSSTAGNLQAENLIHARKTNVCVGSVPLAGQVGCYFFV